MIRSPERRRALRVAFLVAVGGLGAACTAPGDRRPGVPGSGVESIHGRALLGAEYKRTVRSDQEDLQKTILREEIELAIRGRIYDSRFLRYAGAVTLALNQANVSGDGRGFQNLFLPSYFAELRFLPKHRTPLTVFARRDEDRFIVESRASAPLVTTLSQELGASAAYRAKGFEARAEFRRSLLGTSGLDADRAQAQNSYIVKLSHTPRAGITTRALYSFETFREAFSAQDYETHTLRFFNKIRLGALGLREGTSFTTDFDARDRAGTTTYTQVRLSELVRWWINKSFESRTRYDFHLYDAGRGSRRHGFSQEFNHWLYKSLQTTPLAFTSRETFDDGRIDKIGGGIRFDYRKQTRLGPLRLAYTYRFTRQENDLASGVQQVTDEAHVLSTTTVSILQNTDVDTASVVVTNATDAITYTVGFDYDLIPRGRLLEVVRIPGGLIADGQTVLVDYEYRTPNDLTFDTTMHGVLWDYYLFSVVRLYARYDRMRQDPIAGTDGAALEDRDALTVGSELTWRGLRLLGEYTDVDSTTAPYTQQRFEGSYTLLVRNRTRLGVSASAIRTQFPDSASQRNSVLLFRLHTRPARGLSILFEPSYRIERGQGLDRDVLDARLEMRYTVGKLTFSWRVRHFTFVLPGPDTGETFTAFSMERRW